MKERDECGTTAEVSLSLFSDATSDLLGGEERRGGGAFAAFSTLFQVVCP